MRQAMMAPPPLPTEGIAISTSRIIEVPVSPEELPPVDPGDIIAAWNAATVGAELGLASAETAARGIRFVRPDGEELRIVFADIDANCWVMALDRTIGLDTLHGLSTCFRLLGLVEQMATQSWTRDHFTVGGPDGPSIDPVLVRVAATLSLSADAHFNAELFRRRTESLLGPRRLSRH